MSDLATKAPRFVVHVDERLILFMRRYGVTLLRVSLGVVFAWFGLLKLLGRSPVIELVRHTVYWFDADVFVPVLGAWEILVGVGLLVGLFMRVTLLLFWLQMAGTFLVFLVRPAVTFQGGNPLLLTVEGEFVLKNLVLIAAGLVVGGSLHRLRSEQSAATAA